MGTRCEHSDPRLSSVLAPNDQAHLPADARGGVALEDNSRTGLMSPVRCAAWFGLPFVVIARWVDARSLERVSLVTRFVGHLAPPQHHVQVGKRVFVTAGRVVRWVQPLQSRNLGD